MTAGPEFKAGPTVKAPDTKVQAPAPKVEAPGTKVKAPTSTPKAPAPKLKASGGRTKGLTGPGSGSSPVMKYAQVGAIVLAVMALVALLVLLVWGRGLFGGSAHSPRNVSVFDLKPGDCLNPPAQITAQLSSVEVLPCGTPHTQETYALVDDRKAGSNYPGLVQLENFAKSGCLDDFAGYVGVPYQYSSLFYTYLLPSVRSWASDDRTVVCILTTTGQKVTGTWKGSKK
jgi:hypothetical protein